MDVLDRDAVAGVVVPYGEHTARYGRIFFGKDGITYVGWSPVVVEIFLIEIVVIIAGGRDDVDQPVRYGDKSVAVLGHLHWIGVAVVPGVHEHTLGLDRGLSVSMGEGTPDHGLLAVALDEADVVVGEMTELLHDLLVLVEVFIRADMYSRTSEDRPVSLKVFLEEGIHEPVGLGLEQVQMVHAVLQRAYLRHIAGEG